jgi:hypothetical protein
MSPLRERERGVVYWRRDIRGGDRTSGMGGLERVKLLSLGMRTSRDALAAGVVKGRVWI